MKPVTLKDIAQETGYHYTTVARALKNNPLLRKETRKEIQSKAEEMGYRPDPMLQALVKYRHENNPRKSTPTIAFLSHQGPLKSLRNTGGWPYYAGALAQAEHLGYQLQFFWHAEPGISDRRWTQILLTRNIHMLISANFPSGCSDLKLEWDEFSAVKISVAPSFPPVDTVSCNQMQTVRKAFQKLREKGYRRIAMIYDKATDDRLGNMWTAGFLVEQQNIPAEERILPHDLDYSRNPEKLGKFVDEQNVDAIMSYVDVHLEMLQEYGFSIPEHVAYASLNVSREDKLAGMSQSYYQVGVAAVNHVTKLYESNSRGFPYLPSVQYIDSVWMDGHTVGDRNNVETGANI